MVVISSLIADIASEAPEFVDFMEGKNFIGGDD